MQTAVLCYIQPLNKGMQVFFRLFLSVKPIQILPVNKRLRNFRQIQFVTKSSSMYTQNSVCATSTRPFREVGEKSLLLFSLQTYFAKIEDTKVCAKN